MGSTEKPTCSTVVGQRSPSKDAVSDWRICFCSSSRLRNSTRKRCVSRKFRGNCTSSQRCNHCRLCPSRALQHEHALNSALTTSAQGRGDLHGVHVHARERFVSW